MAKHLFDLQETLDPVHLLRCCSSTTSFHKYFNEHIARHGIEFFDCHDVDVNVDYRTVKCFLQITSLVMFDQHFDRVRCHGTTYRGMFITREDLEEYIPGSKIITTSWISSSKAPEVARSFVANMDDDQLLTADEGASHRTAAFCIYIVKNKKTALDIETISVCGSSEREVVILPFSVFVVKRVTRVSECRVEIVLEEVLDDDRSDDPLLEEST